MQLHCKGFAATQQSATLCSGNHLDHTAGVQGHTTWKQYEPRLLPNGIFAVHIPRLHADSQAATAAAVDARGSVRCLHEHVESVLRTLEKARQKRASGLLQTWWRLLMIDGGARASVCKVLTCQHYDVTADEDSCRRRAASMLRMVCTFRKAFAAISENRRRRHGGLPPPVDCGCRPSGLPTRDVRQSTRRIEECLLHLCIDGCHGDQDCPVRRRRGWTVARGEVFGEWRCV